MYVQEKKIVYYDSMGGSGRGFLEAMMRYLQDEHLAKKGCELDASEWELREEPRAPQQRNGCDCGVFTCMVAEALSRGVDLEFDQQDVTSNARWRIALSIDDGDIEDL